jgi:hypothetical protein
VTWKISLANFLSDDRQVVASNLVINPSLSDHGDEDVIRLAHNFNSLAGDFADNPDTQTRAWKGVSPNELLVDLQLPAERPHFVFETMYR